MADEDISLTEDQLLDNLDESNNGDAEFNEVNTKKTTKFLTNLMLCKSHTNFTFCYANENATISIGRHFVREQM